MALIRLRRCAGWSAPLLVTCNEVSIFAPPTHIGCHCRLNYSEEIYQGIMIQCRAGQLPPVGTFSVDKFVETSLNFEHK